MIIAKFFNHPKFLYIACSLLLAILSLQQVKAEPIEPLLSKATVDKLIAQTKTNQENEHQADQLIQIANYYLETEDRTGLGYINNALRISEKIAYQTGIIKSLCIKAAFHGSMLKEPALANQYLDKAIALCNAGSHTDLKAFAYYTKGTRIEPGTPEAEEDLLQSRALYHETGNKIKEAYLLKCIADNHMYQNKLAQALKELLESLELSKAAGNQNLQYTYDLIGSVFRLMGNYEESLKYSLLTIKYAEQNKDSTDLPLFYHRVGMVFKELNQPGEALKYMQTGLQKTQQDGGYFFYIRLIASDMSNILCKTGNPAEALKFYEKTIAMKPAPPTSADYNVDGRILGDIYFSMKQYDKAEKYYLQMLDMDYNFSNYSYFRLTSYIRMGNFYISRKMYAKANDYIHKAIDYKALKSLTDQATIHWQQYVIDSAAGNYLAAIRHYQQYKLLNDSVFNEKKSNQIASLNIQYNTEKKEQEIGSLTFKNNEQLAVLTKRGFERNVFIAGAILLSILLWMSVNRYRTKQESNRQLQEQQENINKKNELLNELLREKDELIQSKDKLIAEKEWLIKEVHHRVKNNLQMVSTLLYTQASYLKDNKALAAINEGQQRIHAISLIHQKLYQSDNLQLVSMKSYVHELVDYLKESFDISTEIEFVLQIDSFELDITRSIPIGLILNEAITNTLKYAFEKGHKKQIIIQLQKNEQDQVFLSIKDNGKGLPPGFDPQHAATLGINLMQGLSTQINGDFLIKTDHGTLITVNFNATSDT